LSKITPDQRTLTDDKAADLFLRLMTSDCKDPFIALVKVQGPAAISTTFNILVQVAMRHLMGDQHVSQGLTGLSSRFKDRMDAFVKTNDLSGAMNPQPQ